MKSKWLLYFSLLIAFPLQAQNDSAYFAGLIHGKVWCYSFKRDSNYAWVIGGENRDKLFRIKKDSVLNVTESAKLPKGLLFTSVLSVSQRAALVGTQNNYLYFIRNSRNYKWLNKVNGLTDSCITGISLRKMEHLVIVSTPQSRFVLKHYRRPYNNTFVQLKDTTRTLDDLAHFFKYFIQKPVQQGICFVTSDIDFSFRKEKYIDEKTLQIIKNELHPGDIIVKRNDAQLANVAIPGFWTHAGIYIGSLGKIDSCFSGLHYFEKEKPSKFIAENYPEVYKAMQGRNNLIIEAIGEGVVINSLEHIAKVDYVAALRPKLDSLSIVLSLFSAFDYFGTSYDYLFDFDNDESLVCSELVYRSYLADNQKSGIKFTFGTLNGKPFLSPNDIVEQFSDERKTGHPQLSFVFYFEGNKNKKRPERKSARYFAKSWKIKD